MNHKTIDLSQAGLGEFQRARSKYFEFFWMIVERLLITCSLQISSRVRIYILRAFGAKIGHNVIIRPRTRIKFPWNLTIGDNCWIGEGVWIHNQDRLVLGCNVVVSQESFITTGSHISDENMDLITKPVYIEDGAWVTSRCIILMGVTIGENSIITPGSVVHKSLAPGKVYGGNPAKFIKERKIK